MAISDKNDRLTIIISKDVKAALSDIADKDGRSMSQYVAKLINDDVSKHLSK